MAGLVDRGEQGGAEEILVHPGGDAHVAEGELGRERVVRLVQAAALEIVTDLPGQRPD